MKINFLFFIIIFLVGFSNKAYAYIDPNAGGFFFTSILPFVYGILATVVIFWKRIVNAVKSIFSGKKGKGDV